VERFAYAGPMPRHESVTDEYIAELNVGLLEEVERVRSAFNWKETQKRMVTGTYALQISLNRVEQGWSRDEISRELGIRSLFGELPSPILVVGNRRIDEDIEEGCDQQVRPS
jgi:hypothetical protein